jgi:hypothetical protein
MPSAPANQQQAQAPAQAAPAAQAPQAPAQNTGAVTAEQFANACKVVFAFLSQK